MNEHPHRPVFRIKYGTKAEIDSFAFQHGLVGSDVLAELKSILRESYFNFKLRPFNLVYSPPSGYVVEAMPIVGVLAGKLFDVEMVPKLPKLALGKCIGLAQHCAMQGVNFINKKPLRGLVSDRKDYSSLEYIALSFYDSVISVIMNGLARKFSEVLIPKRKIEGTINIQETISSGAAFIPIQEVIEPNRNIFPNRFIKTAMQSCINKLGDDRLRKGFCSLLGEFEGIDLFEKGEIDQPICLHEFTIPRSEYHRCLSLAEAILFGRTFEGFGSDELPSFAIDLDLIFEQFCSQQISALLLREKFEVELQKENPHDIRPKVRNKSIVPDALVRNRKNHNLVVIDFKNKYSRLNTDGTLDISNPDLYQIAYYLNTLQTRKGILVYPTTDRAPQYPIRKSESEVSYIARVKKFKREGGVKRLDIFSSGVPVSVYLYQIDLNGSMADTITSVATLCVMAEQLLEE